jgi:ABC-type Mn2+/Zn2+ transport system permease subunit
MSWPNYLWATLVGFVVNLAIATSCGTFILWLDLSLEPVSHGLVLGLDLGIWISIFIGLFVGIFVGTTVGIRLYRRHQNSKPATANFKPGH